MSRFVLLVAPLLTLATMSASALGQSRSDAWLPSSSVRRHGLERVWQGQIQLDRTRHHLKNLQLHVSDTQATTIYEVVRPDGRTVVTEKDLDPFGNLLGAEGAKQRAEQLLATLKAQNVEAALETHVVPKITLYALGSGGTLQAMDAETGEPLWNTTVGNPGVPTEVPGVSEAHVAVINGATLYVLDRASGTTLWRQSLDGAAGAGPAVTDGVVFVPMLSGKIQAYPLDKPTSFPKYFQSFGRIVFQPTASPTSVTWPTDRGFLYISAPDALNVRFRLEAEQTIASRATYRNPNMVFMTSMDGYLYAVHDQTGQLVWRFSTGQSISQAPVPVEDSLFVVTEEATLFRIAAETGEEQWSAARVRQFLAASPERIYVIGSTGRLEILNAQTGARISALSEILPLIDFDNRLTDRLYLATADGLVQCFRERQRPYPTIHIGWEPPSQQPPASEAEPPVDEPAAPAPAEAPASDVFGTESTPAGSTPAPAGDAGPFGPFGS